MEEGEVEGAVGLEDVGEDLLGEAYPWRALGPIFFITKFIDFLQGGYEGGDEGELAAVGLLGLGAGVGDGGGHGAEIAVTAYGVADDGAEFA